MATAVQDLSIPAARVRAHAAWKIAIAALVALAALLIPLLHNFNAGEFAVDYDEPFHATTGAYFADLYVDHPVTHPIRYTYRYYAKYPALGIVHWPPFFYMVEGTVFRAFGISAQSGRLAVLLFVFLGLLYFFRLIEMLQGPSAAVLATFLLALMPGLVELQGAVMLDWPALALCIAATFHWFRWMHEKSSRDLWAFAAFLSLALLTKQQSFWLLGFCLLTLIAQREWHHRGLWIALGGIAAASVPFYAISVAKHGNSVFQHIITEHFRWKPLVFYAVTLPTQVGWWVLPFAAIGIVMVFRSKETASRRNAILMLLWIAACFLTFTFLNAREPRYNIYCIPALLYFAVLPFTARFERRWETLAAIALGALLALGYTAQVWAAPAPFAAGVEDAAQKVLDANISGRPVLFDGDMSGDFTFYMRALDPTRSSIVMRKALYASNILRLFGSVQIVDSEGQIGRLLDDYGIHIVVVSENEPLHFPVQLVLRRYLHTSRFRRIARVRIRSNQPRLAGTFLDVYENLDTKAPTARSLNLKMLTIDHDIDVPMSDLAAHP